jgi:tetratricopeptide (TPR) repeat protein
MDRTRSGRAVYSYLLLVLVMTASVMICGCSHLYEGSPAGLSFKEANDLFSGGNYRFSLDKYELIIKEHPAVADRALFEMGIIYAYPSNEQKDYGRSLECFQRILKDYPESRYRQDSAEMISHIDNVTAREEKIIAQQARIATLEREIKDRENRIVLLQEKIEALEEKLGSGASAIPKGPVSKILIEKGERRLTLMAKEKPLKSYRIALGGNPTGPKERQGDNKTPEGIYIIDARNCDSRYHISLHISYPNEKDSKRARELGVSPGGNIMIHGLKNGFAWVGNSHTESDWTEGCVAVTNEEIEEIAALVPNGTVVEIRP